MSIICKHIQYYDEHPCNVIINELREFGAAALLRCIAELIEQTWDGDVNEVGEEGVRQKADAIRKVVALSEWIGRIS